MIPDIYRSSKKVVVKVGSQVLAKERGGLNEEFIEDLARDVASLVNQGKQVLLVSSGAMAAGGMALGVTRHEKEDMGHKQALCAVGQVLLMDAYRVALRDKGLPVGQMLLTNEDFSRPQRELRIRDTLLTLLDRGAVPIINENDTVSVEEIRIGDNDNLAARVAVLWGADLLILLSDIDGIYDQNPRQSKEAKLLSCVVEPEKLIVKGDIEESGFWGTGGMLTKIQAALFLKKHRIPMILASGKEPRILSKLKEEGTRASLFLP